MGNQCTVDPQGCVNSLSDEDYLGGVLVIWTDVRSGTSIVKSLWFRSWAAARMYRDNLLRCDYAVSHAVSLMSADTAERNAKCSRAYKELVKGRGCSEA